ncbi:MAG: TetR/AcrR family transcriptional regulator [Erysipelotrichaceae bacterium]|nr:TetR/AcrR family transcriptional regulator [Erysipelotrichaceae bacterium]
MAQEKKKEIRDKAAALFQKNGYEKVTVNDIAAASGISRNTFYYYYDSKESIIVALFQPCPSVIERLMLEILQKDTAYEQLALICREGSSYFSRLGKEIVRTALSMNLSGEFLPHKDGKKPIYELIKKLYEKAIEDGSIRNDVNVQQLMDCTCIAFMGCLQIWATSQHDFDLTDAFMETFDIIVKK